MIRQEIVCDVCDSVVRNTKRETLFPFTAFEFDRDRRPYSFKPADADKSARHICNDCFDALVKFRLPPAPVAVAAPKLSPAAAEIFGKF